MSNYISGKTLIVTGAASGFGKLVSEKAAALGGQVVASDINKAALDELVAELVAAGQSAIGVQADVSNREQMNALAQAGRRQIRQH